MKRKRKWRCCPQRNPGFRIPDSAIDNDVEIVKAMGAELVTGREIQSVEELKKDYDYVVLALGASEPGVLKLEVGEPVNALEFLAQFKATDGKVDLGKNVVVIGGGNTAMDTARAAKRNAGVEKVSLVYRRTRRYMPADEEELVMAIEDGVEFAELLSPVRQENGVLICKKMVLGDIDASGRRGVVETDEIVEVPADTVIAAVGEKVPSGFYEVNGIALDSRKRPQVNQDTLETSLKGVYAVGDGLFGPATVVEASGTERRLQRLLSEEIFPRISLRCLMKRLSRTVREIWQKRMKAEQTAEDAFPATATVRTVWRSAPTVQILPL